MINITANHLFWPIVCFLRWLLICICFNLLFDCLKSGVLSSNVRLMLKLVKISFVPLRNNLYSIFLQHYRNLALNRPCSYYRQPPDLRLIPILNVSIIKYSVNTHPPTYDDCHFFAHGRFSARLRYSSLYLQHFNQIRRIL